jgi:hypothetical protein
VGTYSELMLALHNLQQYYDTTDQPRRAQQLSEHVKGVRSLWLTGALGGSVESLIQLDADRREALCTDEVEDWSWNEEAGSRDQMLVRRHVANSTRPREVPRKDTEPGDTPEEAEKRRKKREKAKEKKERRKVASGSETDKSWSAFYDQYSKSRPDLCIAYAYNGACARSSGETCSLRGHALEHTCVHCGFENGKHPIKDGKCPH